MARKRLGALLEERGLINEFQLVAALSHQRKWKGKLGKSLIELGYLEEQQLYEVLAAQLEMTLVDLRDRKIPPDILNKISRKEAEALKAVPVEMKEGELVVAVADAELPDLEAKLTQAAGQPVKMVLGLQSLIENWIALISKIPVAAVQPVKKAFIRNSNGDIELAPDHIQVQTSPPPAEQAPAPVEAEPPAEKAGPVALDEEPAEPETPPAPAEEAQAPEPEMAPPGPKAPAAVVDLEVPDLDLPPPSPPPAAVPAPPSEPAEDLWAMPEEALPPSPPAPEPAPAPELSPEELPPPSLFDLPPPPSLEEPLKETAEEPPGQAEEPPPPRPAEEPLLSKPADLDLSPPDLSLLEEIPLPDDEIEEIALPETEPAPPLDQLTPPPLEDLSPPSFTSPETLTPSPTEKPAAPPPASLEEEPIPLEDREPLREPSAPIEGLVTEDVKAERVGFQEEIGSTELAEVRKVHEAKEEKPAESGLDIVFQEYLEGRVAKLEEEVRQLREMVEDLTRKVKR